MSTPTIDIYRKECERLEQLLFAEMEKNKEMKLAVDIAVKALDITGVNVVKVVQQLVDERDDLRKRFRALLVKRFQEKEGAFTIGVDTYDENHLAYCMTKKANGVITVMACKKMTDKAKFKEEVEMLSKMYNGVILYNEAEKAFWKNESPTDIPGAKQYPEPPQINV